MRAPLPGPPDETPPRPFGWAGLYTLVIAALAASIAALLWLTERWR